MLVPSPITLCRDITSYNRPVSWIQGAFKYIRALSMKVYFPQLTASLDNNISSPVIVNLVGKANLRSNAGSGAQDNNKQPLVNTNFHGADQAWTFPPASKPTTDPPLQGLGSPQGLAQKGKTPHSSTPAQGHHGVPDLQAIVALSPSLISYHPTPQLHLQPDITNQAPLQGGQWL